MAKEVHRRLAAILAADVVGYSRLMGDDEAGTLAALQSHREELFEPKAAQHHGRTVKLMGDGALMEFGSVVDAVTFAVEVQIAMRQRNSGVTEDRQIVFRIGINLGDIILQDEDIYGDGVNVAARLEGLAEPGGICLSRAARDQVRDKLDLRLVDLGEVEVKNISRPVRAFQIILDDKATALVTSVVRQSVKTERRQRPLAIAAVMALLLAAGGAFWWQPWAPDVEPASVERMAFPLPEKPSIAVLPFDNLSGDPEQDYWIDAMTEDIITTLSKVPDMFVIARNSTFTYKNKPTKVQRIAEDLGVRYVLEGSVQIAGERVRVNAQLIDALEGYHVWSERYDREFKDILALQDDITRNIVTEMEVELTAGEGARIYRRGTDSSEAYLHLARGRDLFGRFTRDDNRLARQEFEKALELDPKYPAAIGWLGWTHQVDTRYRWSASRRESLGTAEELARRALELDEESAGGHSLLSGVYLLKRDFERGLAERRRALELTPGGSADGHYMMGWTLTYAGRPEEAIEYTRQAMRLSPFYPARYASTLGEAYRLTGRHDEAIAVLRTVVERRPDNIKLGLIRLVAALVAAGQDEEARAVAEKILRIKPTFTLEGYAKTRMYKDPKVTERLIADLRQAGLPDKPPLKLPDKPSIAVLPFANMSGDPEQAYFADGITEDLTTDLSKISGLFVIARNSAFAYKGKNVDVKRVARELGVKYVLEGSVRRAGDKVRINAQLIDAATGGHLWAERYDGTLDDVFALQDKVTQNIVTALAVTLTPDEAGQAATVETDNVAAYDAFLQGWARYNRQTPKDFAEAIPLFEKAIELDPGYGRAYGALALTYHVGSERGLSGALKVPWYVLRIRARKYLDLALKNPTAPAQVVAALMALKQRLFGDAVAHIERAVALDPNDAEAHSMMAYVLVYDGRPEDAIKHAEQALRLDPNNPSRPLQWIGRAHFVQGNLEESLSWLERAREHNPSVFPAALVVASARAHLGQIQEARAALEVYTDRWGSPPPLETIMYFWSFKDPVVAKRFTDGILQAGLSDESGTYYQVSEDDRLSGAQIDDLLRGRKIGGDGPWDGKRWWRDYGEDSTLSWRGPPVDKVPWHGPSVETDQGVSRVKGDLLCEAWGVINEGYETCFPVFRNPEGTAQGRDEYLFMTDTGIYPWSLLE